jgi:DNA replication licensing factor MCM3
MEKFNPLLHGGASHAVHGDGAGAAGKRKPVELLKISFLKKYISYAKTTVHPTLTDGARELIVANYTELRGKQADGTVAMPITARSLETIIRLSTAHAKVPVPARFFFGGGGAGGVRSPMDAHTYRFHGGSALLS